MPKSNFSDYLQKKWFIGVILVSVFISGIIIPLAGFTISRALNLTNNSQIIPPQAFLRATPAPINQNNPEKGVYNALLLGYGGSGHAGGLLTDSVIVMHVNTNNKKATLISIPRDLWVPGNHKLNSVGVTGFQNVSSVITSITGLPINYYIAVDFSNFVKLIDNLGGITVQVPKSFDDNFYPLAGEENNVCGFTNDQINEFKTRLSGFELEKQFTCRYEQLHFVQGQTNLDGKTALKFVRSRHGDSDFGRSQRQFALIEGIGQKLITLRSMNKINETVDTLFRMVKTDLDLGTIKSLAEVFTDPGLYKINQVQLTTDNLLNTGTGTAGEFILTPKAGNLNFQQIKDYIQSQF